jgi:hypothetical protein
VPENLHAGGSDKPERQARKSDMPERQAGHSHHEGEWKVESISRVMGHKCYILEVPMLLFYLFCLCFVFEFAKTQ